MGNAGEKLVRFLKIIMENDLWRQSELETVALGIICLLYSGSHIMAIMKKSRQDNLKALDHPITQILTRQTQQFPCKTHN